LALEKRIAIVPAPLTELVDAEEPLDAIPVIGWWVRGALVVIVLGLVAVFVIAVRLDPYDENGQPQFSATHQKLGLPPCNFRVITGIPCPSCGMTTSFTWLMHGRVDYSLQANAVGTLLAVFCLLLIPWGLACALWGRPFFLRSLERALMWTVVGFLGLLFLRWFLVLGWAWWTGTRP
jgi:hypothetical protein